MGPWSEGQPESHLMEEGRAEVNISVREKFGNNTFGAWVLPSSTLFPKKIIRLCRRQAIPLCAKDRLLPDY